MAGGDSLYHRAYRALEPTARPEGLSPVNKILVLLIIVASAFAIVETEPMLAADHPALFARAELLFGTAFSIEYVARIWVAPLNPHWAQYRYPRLRYAFSTAAIIDLLAILPLFLTLGTGAGSVLLRFFRVLRILRLAKLGRMSRAFADLQTAVSERKEELFLTISMALFVMLVSSTLMYWAEGDSQPDSFGSIPRAMWWCIVTLTTVGYGDTYPITVLGKFLSSVVAVTGIALIALPTGILASAFSEVVQRRRDAKKASAKAAKRARNEGRGKPH